MLDALNHHWAYIILDVSCVKCRLSHADRLLASLQKACSGIGGAKRLAGITVGSRAMLEQWCASEVNAEPTIDRFFPLDEAPAAYDYLAAGRHFGKVVIEIGS